MANSPTPPSPEAQLLQKVMGGLSALSKNPQAPKAIIQEITEDLGNLISSQQNGVRPDLVLGFVDLRKATDYFIKVYADIASSLKVQSSLTTNGPAKQKVAANAKMADELSQVFLLLRKKIDHILPAPAAGRKRLGLLSQAKTTIISIRAIAARAAWLPAAIVVGGTTYMTTENVNRFAMNITGSDPILFGLAAATLTAVNLKSRGFRSALIASVSSTGLAVATGFLPVAGYHAHRAVHVVSTDAPTAGFHRGDIVEVYQKGAVYMKIDNGKLLEDVLPRGTTMRVDVVGDGTLTGTIEPLGIISTYPQYVKIASPDKAPGIMGPKEKEDDQPKAPQGQTSQNVKPLGPNAH
jgi:hypothetical protein